MEAGLMTRNMEKVKEFLKIGIMTLENGERFEAEFNDDIMLE